MKLLHIINDEKFLDCVINSFTALGVSCRYIWLQSKPEEFRYIKNSDRVDRVRIGSEEYVKLLSSCEYDYIWIHYADLDKIRFINDYCGKAKVIWSTWGADYISLINNNLFEIRTLWEWIKVQKIKKICSYLCRAILAYLHLEFLILPSVYKRFLRKIDFFSSVLPNEERIIRRLLGKRPCYIRFQYTDITRSNNEDPVVANDAKNVWLGNSAYFCNNSIEAVWLLQKCRRDVYAPLSYGDALYKSVFDRIGRSKLGSRWHPICDFMQYDEYLKMMSSCAIFIFNHRRQQAIGNIGIALRSGGLVVLNSKSPAWEYFRGRGLKIYSLGDLKVSLDVIEKDFCQYKDSNIRISRSIASLGNRVNALKETVEFLKSCTNMRDA